MRPSVIRLIVAGTLAAPLAVPTAGHANVAVATHSENMRHVQNISYPARNGTVPNNGTDIEFTTLRTSGGTREFALAGSYRNGLQIVDITNPERARRLSVYDCGVTQGDVQVFKRADLPGRTFVTYTSDTYGDGTSTCYREAAALGFSVLKPNGTGKNGTFIAEITDPARPRTVSFVEVPQGSHNQTVHPSGRYLYNSNSDLITSAIPAIEVFDITDMTNPRLVTELALPTRPGLGTESHDITFNRSGSRAYSAALSQGVIIDTTNPAAPTIVASFLDPAINVWHQSDPVTLTDRVTGKRRDFLIVEDEVAGALPTFQCPNGGVHIYEITGDMERNPVKVGYWNIDEFRPATGGNRCTAHVLDIHEREQIMTIAYYNGGSRVVDISGLLGVGLGDTVVAGTPMKEIAFYRFDNSDTWAAKTPWINPRTGDFYLYGNDLIRGLDIYFVDANLPKATGSGRWKTPAQASADAAANPARLDWSDPETLNLYCLNPQV